MAGVDQSGKRAYRSSARRLFASVAMAMATSLLAASIAAGDEVHLNDGSRLMGTISEWSDGQVVIDASFAEGVTIPAERVALVATDEKRSVTLDSGDRLVGRLAIVDGGQRIVDTAVGAVEIDTASIAAITSPQRAAPQAETRREELQEQVTELKEQHEQQVQSLKSEHEQELAEARQQSPALGDLWSGRIEFGLDGQSGNTDRLNIRGRAEARRTTDAERLLLFIEGRHATEEGDKTANELFGGARLDVDFAERWFAFGKTRLEFDEFEDLDLRVTTTGGVGRFLIRREAHELSVRAGAGFEHESFQDGTSTTEPVGEAGYDYRLDLDRNVRLTHSLTYHPTFTDPTSDFRVTVDTGLEFPIGDSEAWRFRAGLRNEFDNMPQPGVDQLDNLFFINLGYNW